VIFALRSSAAPERKHQHASACSFRAEHRKQNFLFLLKEKIGARKIKKCEGNFSARPHTDARCGGASLRLGRLGRNAAPFSLWLSKFFAADLFNNFD
jgi:hypothetical protein